MTITEPFAKFKGAAEWSQEEEEKAENIIAVGYNKKPRDNNDGEGRERSVLEEQIRSTERFGEKMRGMDWHKGKCQGSYIFFCLVITVTVFHAHGISFDLFKNSFKGDAVFDTVLCSYCSGEQPYSNKGELSA